MRISDWSSDVCSSDLVTHAAQQRWGKPILFKNVKGTKFPVLTNTYGSRERLAEIIGIEAGDFCRQWNNLASLGGSAPEPAKVLRTDDELATGQASGRERGWQ